MLVGPAGAAHSRVLASATVSRARGGSVKARSGVALYVPPHTIVRRRAHAEITSLGHHRFAITILGAWQGRVRVTLPKPGRGLLPIVLHKINGSDHVESRSLGEMTVWVTHLSEFDVGFPDVCFDFVEDPAELTACLVPYGIFLTAEGVAELVQLAKGHAPLSTPPGGSAGVLPAPQGGSIQGSSPNLQGGAPPSGPSNPSPPAESNSTPPPSYYVYYVENTCRDGACGLHVRSGPGYSSYASIEVLTDGTEVKIVCQALGQEVGPSPSSGVSSAIWDKLTNGGWVSDLYITTPNAGTWSPPIPQC